MNPPATKEETKTYQILLTRAQMRVLRETAGVFRMILKGEFRSASQMLKEKNRKAATTKGEETLEGFDQRLALLEEGLRELEMRYTGGRYFNILQLGPAASILLRLDRKLKNGSARPSSVNNVQYPVLLEEDELRFLGRAAELGARILMGQIEEIADATAWQPKKRLNEAELREEMRPLTRHATGLDSALAHHGILSDRINYKARWLYDVWHAIQHHLLAERDIETVPHKKIGTEPMPLIQCIDAHNA